MTESGVVGLRRQLSAGAFDGLIVSNPPLRFPLPEDLPVVSLNGQIPRGVRSPGFLDQCPATMGTWAAEFLLNELALGKSGLPEKQKVLLVEPEWIEVRKK
jgi:hypothetical protein